MKKYVLLSILSLTIVVSFIYFFQLWIDIHDAKIIRDNIRNMHLMDSNNTNEIQYPDEMVEKMEAKSKIPWGINKLELIALLQVFPYKYENLDTETNEFVRLKRDNNLIRTFFFNSKEQYFCVKEEQFYEIKDKSFSHYKDMEYYVIYKGYILMLDEEVKSVTDLSWIDSLGNEQNLTLNTIDTDITNFYDIVEKMNIELKIENMDEYALMEILFEKYELIIHRTWNYNDSCLEFITKKYNESKIVSEFILKNRKLAN